MIPLDHVLEIALLISVAYLIGCALGYGAHVAWRTLAARPRVVSRHEALSIATAIAVSPTTAIPAGKSAARRLANAVERDVAAPSVKPVPAAQQRPPQLPAPRQGKPDDLRQIKGIGAKTESALHDLGIYHLDQIAAWTPSHIDWLEGRIAVKGRIRREQWVEQAVLLLTATAPA